MKPKLKTNERLTMDVPALARKLGINTVLAYKLVREGQIPALRFEGSRRVLIPIAAVEKMLADPKSLHEMMSGDGDKLNP